MYRGAGLVNLSVASILIKFKTSPTFKGGNILLFSSSLSSSVLSKYTFKKPSNFNTSPVAVKVSAIVEIDTVAKVLSI